MNRILTATVAFILFALTANGADPTATKYSWDDCQGTNKPYPEPTTSFVLPDSLTPVMINHVGHHGSRYPSNARAASELRKVLADIDEAVGLTPAGKELLSLTDKVIETCSGHWGSLSSRGMAEQRGIASRMVKNWRPLFSSGRINAQSSYSPRSIMSMYEFVHQLSRMDNNINVTTTSGRNTSPLLRFFDDSSLYHSFLESEELTGMQSKFTDDVITTAPLLRLAAGKIDELLDKEQQKSTVLNLFSVLTSLQAFGMNCNPATFLTPEEQNALWSIENMEKYLRWSDSVLSAVPADIAAALLDNLVQSFDAYLADATSTAPIQLRFGHAETIMPLASLLRLPGCYYLTNYFDTVGLNWKDFYVAPMSANIQMVMLKAKKSGNLYLLTELNEEPVSLIPGNKGMLIPWPQAREYLLKCLPFDYGVTAQ